MFDAITIPFDTVMLKNVVKLKEGVSIDDAQLAMGVVCNVVKNNYSTEEGGFVGGQVFKYTGFISEEGSVNSEDEREEDHLLIVTYWRSFEQHEASHADVKFNEVFSELLELCDSAYELGYELLWQHSE